MPPLRLRHRPNSLASAVRSDYSHSRHVAGSSDESSVVLGEVDDGKGVLGSRSAWRTTTTPLVQDDLAIDEEVTSPDPGGLAVGNGGVETLLPNRAGEAEALGCSDVIEIVGVEADRREIVARRSVLPLGVLGRRFSLKVVAE